MIRDYATVHVQDRAVVQAMDALVGLLHRIQQRRALALQQRIALVAGVPRLRTATSLFDSAKRRKQLREFVAADDDRPVVRQLVRQL